MQKLSQKITELVSRHEHGVTLGQLLDKMDRQGVGFLLVLLSLPLLVPLPPGVGSPAGALLLVWSAQRLLGVGVPWCPAFLRRRRLSRQVMEKLLDKGIPLIQKLERFGGASSMQASETAVKAACMVVMVMATLVILPTPFLNPLFAIVILLLGISLTISSTKLYIVGIFSGASVTFLLLSAFWAAFSESNLLFWQ